MDWFVGSNGNAFADFGGFRYCVYRDQDRYCVARNGIDIAAPDCLSGPAGFKNETAAKQYAKWYADNQQ